MTASTYWQELGTGDFHGLDPETTIALLPVAAVEQHGPHLPLATDAAINVAMVAALLKQVPDPVRLLVLPAMTVGHSLEHTDFPGTLSIAAETLLASWLDIGRSVARTGLRKLVILNSHGGQISLVQLAALRLRQECGMFVVRANYFSLGSPPGLFADDELKHGLHGGEVETSLMLHLRPDLVRREALANFEGLNHQMAAQNRMLGAERPMGFGWMSRDLNVAGVCGNAARADAQRGQQLFDYLVRSLVTLLGEIASHPLRALQSR
jgi:creatinine amidohydrolase